MTREEAIYELLNAFKYNVDDLFMDACNMAIEALKREAHDGCDGCRYEENDELTAPCTSCKQNYTDRYMPMPNHDRDWIVGCIKHDGFIKTDRGDKANQIILEALQADAVEVVRYGTWIENKTRTYCIRADLDTITCNKCGYDYPKCTPMFSREYCPNCGAKMDGERSE